MPPALAPEILQRIFAGVYSRKTLLDILVCSHQFCRLAEPYVYAQIRFPGPAQTSKLSSLLESLETSDGRRAPYVRALSFPAISNRSEMDLIHKILAKTAKLQRLELGASSSSSSRTSLEGYFARRSHPFSLTSLRISAIGAQHDQGLLDFLEAQTSLRTLHLRISTRAEPADKRGFSPTASFPDLQVLSAPSYLVHSFLRASAHLTHLLVFGRVYWHDPEIRTTTMRTLACSQGLAADAVASLASLFPDLQWLEAPVEAMERLRPRNGRLRGIRFTDRSLGARSSGALARLFAAAPDLQFVEYMRYGYERQYRHGGEPRPVLWLCRSGSEWLADWEEDVIDDD
ncbi:hypothetical protein PLEOSDRAFT_1090979 [Pleurotus ostreatus PC15]|uniref:F-box domain-containing protein n=1 Tax=Pleurotus ostreatus (strain PC15) TaxID=1137138 RepID=A0A067N3N5_PLEO1|nr:hypothetical protein PLEOSDRAFT_1090979 [Pleurotus ostreatus PC15]